MSEHCELPKQMFVSLTNECNLRCPWCYASSSGFKGEMSFEIAKAAIKAARELGVAKVMLIGGEPTMAETFFPVIELIAQSGMRVTAATNGVAFSDEVFSKKARELGLSSLNVSLKGFNSGNYASNTGQKALGRALDGYKNAKKHIPNAMLSYVMQGNDIQEARELRALLEANEIASIYIQQLKPDGRVNQDLNPKVLAKAIEIFYRVFEGSPVRTVFECSVPLCLIDGNILRDLMKSKRILTTCYIRKGNAFVLDVNGNLLPCNHLIGYPLYEFDSLTADSLAVAINCDKALAFRKILNRYPTEKCSTCSSWTICGGGCPLRWLTYNPDDFIARGAKRVDGALV